MTFLEWCRFSIIASVLRPLPKTKCIVQREALDSEPTSPAPTPWASWVVVTCFHIPSDTRPLSHSAQLSTELFPKAPASTIPSLRFLAVPPNGLVTSEWMVEIQWKRKVVFMDKHRRRPCGRAVSTSSRESENLSSSTIVLLDLNLINLFRL